ncbi:TetR/AcrR family transcriptional regulator [Aquirufa nivalisilvae]|uniref:TetR/AcrR family transcriptional regulator n=1 Tax=Aquirufa nivalisilvae TaxID=2516557 RepID=UPI001032FB9A|nr:TetR/AcrR family transcriptional regulator [Aquirufa nivalisilvae]TBH76491.1 TetR/AcrR family transcriptional regulator [Aquirufa nivalisilvae]
MKCRILEKGAELYFRYGVRSVTMDTIATELGISKKTIYQHFPDKDAMVYQVLESFIQNDQCKWEDLNKSSKDVIHKTLLSLEIMKTTLSEMNPRLMFEVKKYFPKAYDLFTKYKEDCIMNSLKVDLKTGIEQGYFRPEIEIELIARLRMGEVDLSFDPNFYSHSKLSFFDTQQILLDHFMRGILTEKGLSLYLSYQNNN